MRKDAAKKTWKLESARRLDMALDAAGLRNVDVERALGAGFSSAMVSLWRHGHRIPKAHQLEAMLSMAKARGVRVSADSVMGFRDDSINLRDVVQELEEVQQRVAALIRSLTLLTK